MLGFSFTWDLIVSLTKQRHNRCRKEKFHVSRTVLLVSFGTAKHVNTHCIVAQVSQNLIGKNKMITF